MTSRSWFLPPSSPTMRPRVARSRPAAPRYSPSRLTSSASRPASATTAAFRRSRRWRPFQRKLSPRGLARPRGWRVVRGQPSLLRSAEAPGSLWYSYSIRQTKSGAPRGRVPPARDVLSCWLGDPCPACGGALSYWSEEPGSGPQIVVVLLRCPEDHCWEELLSLTTLRSGIAVTRREDLEPALAGV